MKTAVIAFDSQQFNVILARMLNDLGFRVVTSEFFMQAVDACREKKADVLLTDWTFDGKSIQDLLKKISPFSNVVLVSQKNTPSEIEKALKLGIKEYIMKPFDSDILQNKLATLELI